MQRIERKQNVIEELNLPLKATANIIRFVESRLKAPSYCRMQQARTMMKIMREKNDQ